ncbi:MAG: hypothetical protein JWQ17_1353 [Tardiphaga sp.]|nr:hypothetical protein [Tardiphaga sp.]
MNILESNHISIDSGIPLHGYTPKAICRPNSSKGFIFQLRPSANFGLASDVASIDLAVLPSESVRPAIRAAKCRLGANFERDQVGTRRGTCR